MATTQEPTPARAQFETNDNDDEGPRWRVAVGGFSLAKVSYSRYELRYGSMGVQFDDIRDNDDGTYELRSDRTTNIGSFDPADDSVPTEIQMAFRVLAEEIWGASPFTF